MKKNRTRAAALILAAIITVSAVQVFAAEETVSTEPEITQDISLPEIPEEDTVPSIYEEPEIQAEIAMPEAEPAETVAASSAEEAIPAGSDPLIPAEPEALKNEEPEEPEVPKIEEAAEPEKNEEEDPAAEEDYGEVEEEEELLKSPDTPVVSYRTHVQNIGWQDYVKDGALSGTTGKSLRLEGLNIKVEGVKDLGIEYRAHVQNIGWQDYVANDAMAGTSGKSLRLEAVNIRLTGDAASQYDVYYCVHVQDFGWLNWAVNDEMSGTSGFSKRLEGICIRILPKGSPAPAPLGTRSESCLYSTIQYRTHVQDYGWLGYVSNGNVSGTTGQSKRLEAIQISLGDCPVAGSVKYRTHIQDLGWETGFSYDNAMSGTSGQSKRLEAIEIALEGAVADVYDIYYRTHVQNYGWTGWASNGEPCGSEGCSYRLEAIEIRMVPKGGSAPGSTSNTFYTVSKIQKDMNSLAQYYYSATNWLIMTNVTTHMTCVYHWSGSSWDLYREILCSTGAPTSPTVEGEFIVQAKILYFGTSYYRCWYATQFYGDYLFHTVLYNVADGPYTIQDGRLGMSISQGCVRMAIEDAKWIYDNIPSGTKVVVYH